MSEEAAAASEGETRTRLGAGTGLAEADARTDVEDADVVVAEFTKEWRRGPALEHAGTLAMTRKMLLMVRARRR